MIQLVRTIGVGMEVLGLLYLPNRQILKTIENKHYLFNDGIYTLKFESSLKFGRKLWEFTDITGRSEIKFHSGNQAINSRGCPLLSSDHLAVLHSSIDNRNVYKIKVVSKKQRLTTKLKQDD